MDERLPQPGMAGGAVWPHDWHSYNDYQDVHYSHLRNLEREGILLENLLSIEESTDSGELTAVRIRGELRCRHDVAVSVDKTLDVRYVAGKPEVKGVLYTYHAWIAGTDQSVIRYDMSHHWLGLHCHLFDLKSGGETTFSNLSLDALPSLDEFIRIADQRVRDAGVT